MRSPALAVLLALSGCATTGSQAQARSAPPPPAAAPTKMEVTVFGRGAPTKPPGEISIAPKDQGLNFDVAGRQAYRCTKTDSKDPDERVYCRNLNNGDSRNPDPGRLERSKTQAGWH